MSRVPLRHFNRVLILVSNARRPAGVVDSDDGRPVRLTPQQFEAAHSWLREFFENQLMFHKDLKADMLQLQSRRGGNYKWKNDVRQRRRDAFRAWKFHQLNNTPLLLNLIRHGMQEPKEMCKFLLAVEAEKEASTRRSTAYVETREQQRKQAFEARRRLEHAQKLALKFEKGLDRELRPDEDLVLQMLDSCELEHIVATKNERYGHGKGIHNLSLESRAIARVINNDLEKYFASD